MSDRSKVMIQTERDTLALQVGGLEKALTVKKLLTIASNRKRGQGSSWTVAPEEEEESTIT
jgi:hypothetical protein